MGKRGAVASLSGKPGTVYESAVGITPAPEDAKRQDGRGIWEEYYPLIQPARQYHHHRDGRGASSYFFHGMFSTEVVCAYRDAVFAYLVTIVSMTIFSLTGLIFCQLWGIHPPSRIIFGFRCLWLLSPTIAALSLRHIADGRLKACNTPTTWNIPPLHHLFKCFPTRAMLRLSLLSYTIPVLCELAAFSFTAATRMVNPFNRKFVHELEMVFSFNDVDALDSGLVFYVFYTSILGIFWDPLPPPRYDFGRMLSLRPMGCSWFLLAIIQEIGWSGSLFPALEIVFSHSSILASAITGLIWALWHWPMIIADAIDAVPAGSGYPVVETREFHLLYVLSAFTLLLIGSRIIMCWIQGNSCYIIWSSVIYHATHKLFIVSVFGQLTAPIYQKAELFSFFSSEASISVLVTVWFSTCILAQMFRWNDLVPLFTRRARRSRSSLV
ncbi:hypothetical protein Poli38472_005861 [Pythium oligandrum]|uniref:CAAX prenyl protease 2/Lysostaphin resistance protein A-like domain-containing protein n=1 Tax=Pythium oligandrum TaxID=41045 RepID=A0A8K1CUA4_PYTOL|nr:hypothetical protein Poli38472_005861 [Pythium oligandrum]|eukprot:TMW68393.1 hypothetical protein Poli38472_005861 [Pythium oligandrum]